MVGSVQAPWVSLTASATQDQRRALVAECRRELARGHELYGRIETAVARCSGCDDVVFRLRGDTGFALVHLTWRGKREEPPYPHATVLPTFLALERMDAIAMEHELLETNLRVDGCQDTPRERSDVEVAH